MADATRSKTVDDPLHGMEHKIQQQINALSEEIANSHDLVQLQINKTIDSRFDQMMAKFNTLQASLLQRDKEKGSDVASPVRPRSEPLLPRSEPLLPTPPHPPSTHPSSAPWPPIGNPSPSNLNLPFDDVSPGNQGSAWTPKVDFPRFHGVHARGWIRKCEKWFQIYRVPPHERVGYASVHMHDVAETWFLGWVMGKENVDWTEFVSKV